MASLKAALKRGPFRNLYRRAASQKRVLHDWVVTHVLTGSRTVDTPHGFRLVGGKYGANRMMQDGTFEPEEVAIAKQCLGEADIFVDVGANIGYYTCLAGMVGKPVLAFEPQPRNLSNLYESIRLNRLEHVEVFPMALGGAPGVAEIFGASGPSASLLRDWAGYSPSYKQRVSVNTMDAVIGARLHGKRAFIKIDVEGFEYQVLLGAKEIIHAQPKPTWMMEICLNEFHPGGTNLDYERTFAVFFDAGYRVFAADSKRTEVFRHDIEAWRADNKSPLGTFDYLIRA